MATSGAAADVVNDPMSDPKRRPNSKDPSWMYAYWADPSKRDWVTCNLCKKEHSGGIKRLKQHLAGGYGDVILCGKVSSEVRREMKKYLDSKKQKRSLFLDDIEEGEAEDDEVVEVAQADVAAKEKTTPKPKPSSGTAAKRRHAIYQFRSATPHKGQTTPKSTKTIDKALRRTPEQVVDER